MILSALLTSVGINLCLCLLFFTLYSILRKQPSNADVYAPRLVAEGKAQEGSNFNLDRLLPSTSWVINAWRPTEDEVLAASGLDGVVFLRIFIFSLKVFTFAAIVGLFILLPINYFGNQLTIDFYDLPNKSVDSFSISNVDDGSNRLWVHFCAMYVFTAFVCYLLYSENGYISAKRIAYFYSSKPQPHQFTVVVRSVPKVSGESFSGSVEKFFKDLYPSAYLSHSMVHRTRKVQRLINDADKLCKKLAHVKSTKHASQRFGHVGFWGLFGRKVDLLENYGKKLEDVKDELRMQRSLLSEREIPAAFVSFKSRFGAAIALHIPQGQKPTEWVTELGPEPQDIHWPFFAASFIEKWINSFVVVLACTLLTILFFIPVAVVQGLTHLDQLEKWFPFLKGILSMAVVSQVITGYLPSLILKLFLHLVSPVMIMLSTIQGYVAQSQIEKSACAKILWFTVWNIFFANVLTGSALYKANLILEPKEIPNILAAAVPGQASFFIAYVVTSGWTSTSSELFRLFSLLHSFVFTSEAGDRFEVPSIPYHSDIPGVLFFGLLGITYFFLAPLILPFLLVYYCLGYITYKHQLLNVYSPKFETGGTFWPVVHNSIIFSLILMHIIATGIFGLKKLPLASSLTVPLPLITLLFNSYCQKRFLPIFKAYPAECLIKKDRDDQNDPAIADFYEKLVTAYQDPALAPTLFSGSTNSHNSPLLQAADV